MIPTSHNILDVIILTEIFPLLSYCSICTVQIASNVFMVSKFQGKNLTDRCLDIHKIVRKRQGCVSIHSFVCVYKSEFRTLENWCLCYCPWYKTHVNSRSMNPVVPPLLRHPLPTAPRHIRPHSLCINQACHSVADP